MLEFDGADEVTYVPGLVLRDGELGHGLPRPSPMWAALLTRIKSSMIPRVRGSTGGSRLVPNESARRLWLIQISFSRRSFVQPLLPDSERFRRRQRGDSIRRRRCVEITELEQHAVPETGTRVVVPTKAGVTQLQK